MEQNKIGHVFGKVHDVRDDRIVLTHGNRSCSFIHVMLPPHTTDGERNALAVAKNGKHSKRLCVEKDKAGVLWLRPYRSSAEIVPITHNGRRKR